MSAYYRVHLSQKEPLQTITDSSHQKSDFKRKAESMSPHCQIICELARTTGLQLRQAISLAKNIPAFQDVIDNLMAQGKAQIPLLELGIDSVEDIDRDVLKVFNDDYREVCSRLNLFFDWEDDCVLCEYLWESVRKSEYPDKPSRLSSVFCFDDRANAEMFYRSYRDEDYVISSISLLSGTTERFDMNWFTDFAGDLSFDEAICKVRSYWSKEYTSEPILEILHEGKYKLVG